jgi:hypothetical protein
VIVKVEGAGVDPANKVLDQVLDLPAEDYNEVLGKVNEVTKDKKKSHLLRSPKTLVRWATFWRYFNAGSYGKIRLELLHIP